MPSDFGEFRLKAPDDLARGDLALLKGLQVMRILPLLRVVFVPSIPMKEDRLSTAGSWRTAAARACWRFGHRSEGN